MPNYRDRITLSLASVAASHASVACASPCTTCWSGSPAACPLPRSSRTSRTDPEDIQAALAYAADRERHTAWVRAA